MFIKFRYLTPVIMCAALLSLKSHAQNILFTYSPSYVSEQNSARTKDAEIGDINNDGRPDIIDVNSNSNSIVLRINNGDGFDVLSLPSSPIVSYDGDLVDLNMDGLPELIRTESDGLSNQVAVYRNRGANFGNTYFDLSSPAYTSSFVHCPDDIATGDLNNDGKPDFAVTQFRNGCNFDVNNNESSSVRIFLNRSISSNNTLIVDAHVDLTLSSGGNIHDVFFLDANADGHTDILLTNDSGLASQIFLNDGGETPNFTPSTSFTLRDIIAGEAADLNGDGYDDFVLAGRGSVIRVFINSSSSPGNFSVFSLPASTGSGIYYDIELGDLDLDGDIDIVAGINDLNTGRINVWENRSTINNPNNFQRVFNYSAIESSIAALSVDLIDFDADNDLDLYVAGGDLGGNSGCSGCATNDFYINDLDPIPTVSSFHLLVPGSPNLISIPLLKSDELDLALSSEEPVQEVIYSHNFDRYANSRHMRWVKPLTASTRFQFKAISGNGPRTENNFNIREWTDFEDAYQELGLFPANVTSHFLQMFPDQIFNERHRLPRRRHSTSSTEYYVIFYRMRTELPSGEYGDWRYIKPIWVYYPD